jgi:hypothetical protein
MFGAGCIVTKQGDRHVLEAFNHFKTFEALISMGTNHTLITAVITLAFDVLHIQLATISSFMHIT